MELENSALNQCMVEDPQDESFEGIPFDECDICDENYEEFIVSTIDLVHSSQIDNDDSLRDLNRQIAGFKGKYNFFPD